MSTYQMTLIDISPTVAPSSDEDDSIRSRFEAFDKLNPHVFEALKAICLGAKAKGLKRWSIKAAWEDVRWYNALKPNGKTARLCNDYHSHYARKLMSEIPELTGFFETRTLREGGRDE